MYSASINSLRKPGKQRRILQCFKGIMNTGQYAEGHYTRMLEAQFSAIYGCNAISTSSCGSALYLMFRWHKEHGATTVAVQNNTFYATGAMALEAGLKVHLIDSSPNCPSMGAESLHHALDTQPIDLVCLTHVGGAVAQDYRDIYHLCKKYGKILVEDCAHAMGASFEVGLYGETSAWSFYSTKAVPAGEGGMLMSKNPELLRWANHFKDYGKHNTDTPGVIRYTAGMNLRISEWTAAVAYNQLVDLTSIMRWRRYDARRLEKLGFRCLLGSASNFYKYPVDASVAQGLETTGKVYAKSDQLYQCLPSSRYTRETLPHSKAWAEKHACLPVGEGMYRGMTDTQILDYLHGRPVQP